MSLSLSSGIDVTTVARYTAMLRIRMIEEAIADRYAEQEMRCPVHLSIGQEAIAVGVCSAMELRDRLFGTHRAHAQYLAKGGALAPMIAEIYGRADGCAGGRGGSMHLIDLSVNMLGATPIVGSTVPLAVGSAFSSRLQGSDEVTVVFFGDGMTEEGVWSESLNFAALKNLPVVFVCENNFFSVYSPLSVRQARSRDRVAIAAAHGLAVAHGDGNDVEFVHATAATAIARARRGYGPTYLEFETYRFREHCGPSFDNDLGYRSPAEFTERLQRDPIIAARTRLLESGLLAEHDDAMLTQTIAREIDEAFAAARASAPPSPRDFARHTRTETP